MPSGPGPQYWTRLIDTSEATNTQLSMVAVGDRYHLNGRSLTLFALVAVEKAGGNFDLICKGLLSGVRPGTPWHRY